MLTAHPISTAPRDGTVIIGFDSYYNEVFTIRWSDSFGWVGSNFDDMMDPTHWLPMPVLIEEVKE